MSANYILAMDQGTTSSRAIIFDKRHTIVEQAQEEFAQHFPETDARYSKAIFSSKINCCQIAR